MLVAARLNPDVHVTLDIDDAIKLVLDIDVTSAPRSQLTRLASTLHSIACPQWLKRA